MAFYLVIGYLLILALGFVALGAVMRLDEPEDWYKSYYKRPPGEVDKNL